MNSTYDRDSQRSGVQRPCVIPCLVGLNDGHDDGQTGTLARKNDTSTENVEHRAPTSVVEHELHVPCLRAESCCRRPVMLVGVYHSGVFSFTPTVRERQP